VIIIIFRIYSNIGVDYAEKVKDFVGVGGRWHPSFLTFRPVTAASTLMPTCFGCNVIKLFSSSLKRQKRLYHLPLQAFPSWYICG